MIHNMMQMHVTVAQPRVTEIQPVNSALVCLHASMITYHSPSSHGQYSNRSTSHGSLFSRES